MNYTTYYLSIIILIIACYIVGNISGAIILSVKIKKEDIRALGSKNPGTTNMARVFGLKLGIITFFIDSLKGFISAFIGQFIFFNVLKYDLHYSMIAGYIAGLGVILGHNYPIIYNFRGGKGFATTIGVLIAMQPVPTIIFGLTGILLLFIVERMSVFALVFFLVEAIYHQITFGNNDLTISIIMWIYFILGLIAHIPNIRRILQKSEEPLSFIRNLKRNIVNGKK